MAPQLQNITAPPIPSPFSAGDNVTGVSLAWKQWFQSLVTSIQAALANISSQAISPVTSTTLPTLNMSDAGFLVVVTDFNHVLQWTGTAWTWGPGDIGSGYIDAFLSAPTAAGWHLCDGSTVNRLNADGSVSTVTLPNYTTASYLKFGTTPAPGPNAASGQTASVSAGTPSGTNTSTTSASESADQTVQSGSGATVPAAPHTHTVPGQTFTGAAMNPHSHGPGTIDLQNTQLLAYFRQ